MYVFYVNGSANESILKLIDGLLMQQQHGLLQTSKSIPPRSEPPSLSWKRFLPSKMES